MNIIVLVVLSVDACKANTRILLEDNYYAIVQRLEALENKSQVQESKSQTLETRIAHLEIENAALKAIKPVVFLALLTKDVTGLNHYIHFDDVKLNVGNAYSPIHGVFVAPYNGTYQFTLTACSVPTHYVVLEFYINTLVYDRLLAGDQDFTQCSSKTIFASLKENDDVFVKQHAQYGDFLKADNGYGLPSFGGVFLSAN